MQGVKMKTLGRLIFLTVLALSTSFPHAAQPLQICDDEGGWPPYTFADPKNPQLIIGASAELIVEILRRAGYEPVISLMPWMRCQREVEEGRMEIMLDAAYSEERARTYLISKPLYSINSALFYMKSKFPTPPKITRLADMKQYRYCGLFGYNYTMYNLPESQLDTGARDEPSRFKKLQLDRCDFVLGDVELLNAFAALGQLDLSGTAHIPIPGAKRKEFHAMVSRKLADSDKLVKTIDGGIAALKADKTYARIFKKYGM
jgi:polar amino acid transport system substrate-binding protein